VLLHGPSGAGQDAAARAIATAAGRPLVVVDTPAMGRIGGQPSAVISLAFREALLQGADIYWRSCDALVGSEASPHAWDTLIEAASQFGGLTMLDSRTAWEPDARSPMVAFRRIDFSLPEFDTRRRIWSSRLTTTLLDTSIGSRDALAAELANGFQLTEGQIEAAVETANGLAALRDPRECRTTRNDLFEGCRRQSGRHLMTFARRIETPPELTDDHLSLPPASKRQIAELRQRIELLHRVHSGLGFDRRLSLGKGLIALFTGGPGTGKTMAAGLLARDCERDLYKVDLSAIVSKWVGETEKNLERVFAEAADTSAILFFDEADSIFGKRGEVKDAQDRWANMEVNYLLQRIEEYSGVVILASNFRQNIDESFLRRIHVLVDFPFPDADARFEILASLFPPGVNRPADDELRQVAQTFKLSGGLF
jgi:ATP-dependent 26S proteasome regulatory subunit